MSDPAKSIAPRPGTAVVVWFVVATAILQLPPTSVSELWSIACVAAGFATFRVLDGIQRRAVLPAVGGITIVGGCAFAASLLSDAPAPAGLLAGFLLAALGFHASRRRDSDIGLVVFLGFCLILVGAILVSDPTHPQRWLPTGLLLPTTLASLLLLLQIDTGPAVSSPKMLMQRLRWTLHGLTTVALATILVGFTWRYLEEPATSRTTQLASRSEARGVAGAETDRRGRARTSIGLSSEFGLDSGGSVLDLNSEEICRLEILGDGGAPPPASRLLLRYTSFETAGASSWGSSAVEDPSRSRLLRAFRPYQLHPLKPGNRSIRGRLEYLTDLKGHVLVPTETWRIEAFIDLEHDPVSGLLRSKPLRPGSGVLVDWSQGPRRRIRAIPTDTAPREYLGLGPSLTPHRAFLESKLVEFAGPDARELAQHDLDSFARRLVDSLQSQCIYRLQAPKGRHGVELLDFLDRDSDPAGFCMHFAAAAATLLRLVDVPCRIAVGLADGRADPTDPRRRTFGSRDAHAWVEVYQGPGDWVVVDPSPSSRASSDTAEPSGGIEFASWFAWLGLEDSERGFGYGALTVAALTGAAWLASLFAPVRTPPTPGRPRPVAVDLRGAQRARRDLDKLLGALRRIGIHSPVGASLEKLGQTVRERYPSLPVDRAFRAFQDVRYGGRPYDGDRRSLIADATEKIRKRATLGQP